MAITVQTAAAARVITATGGDTLFAIAARELGSATQWNRIARLNGLSDPWIVGIVTLKLPRVDALSDNGGVLE